MRAENLGEGGRVSDVGVERSGVRHTSAHICPNGYNAIYIYLLEDGNDRCLTVEYINFSICSELIAILNSDA